MQLRFSDVPPFDTIKEALRVTTSRQRLKQVLATPMYANSLYLMSSSACTALFSFLFWLIAARFYAESVVGYNSAIISALNLIALLSMVGINVSLVRFLSMSDKPVELIKTCLTIGGLISVVAGGIFLAGLDIWSPALGFIRENLTFCLTFIIFALLWTLSILVDHVFLAARRTKFTLFKNAIVSVLKPSMLILLALFFDTFGAVAAWGGALAIALAVALFSFMSRAQVGYKPLPALNFSLLKDMWRYSAGNYLTDLLILAPHYLLPLMIINILGAEQNAYFYIAWMMGYSLTTISVATYASLFAEGSHSKDRLKENVRKSLRFTFLLLVPAVILFVVAGKWLLLAFGESYSLNALYLLWALCFVALPTGINHIYTAILRVTGRIKELMLLWGFIALSVLVTSYLLMTVTGIIGIGYACLGTQIVSAVYSSVRIRRIVQLNNHG